MATRWHLGARRVPEIITAGGILFAAGPIVDENGQSQGPGMIVIRAKNMKEAKRIADNDPFHKLGYRKYTIRAWMVNEGGFNLRVRYSDGGFTIV